MYKIKKIIFFSIIHIIVLTTIVFAHSGRTDSNGGHWDYSTGEYHYHHGYSSHQHINGLCPYESSLEELLPEKCPKCNDTINHENGIYCFECGYELIELTNMTYITDGSPNKTRSEYYEEVESLENKISRLEDTINNLENSMNTYEAELEEYGYNSINEMNNRIYSLDTQISNMWFYFFLVGLIAICISYNIGASKKQK